jgi:hypothetical protein
MTQTTALQYAILDKLLNELDSKGLLPLLQRVRKSLEPTTEEEIQEDIDGPGMRHLDVLFVRDLGPFVGTDEELCSEYLDWLEENMLSADVDENFDILGSLDSVTSKV